MVGVQPNTIKGEGKSRDTEKTPIHTSSLTHTEHLFYRLSMLKRFELVFWLLAAQHVLELHNCPKNLECELSFSTGTFLIERLLLVGICSTVRKGPKRTWDTTVETTYQMQHKIN